MFALDKPFAKTEYSYCYSSSDKLKSIGFRATGLSTYDFSTLFTTLPHNLIKKNQINLIESTFHRQSILYLACDDKIAFFTSDDQKRF